AEIDEAAPIVQLRQLIDDREVMERFGPLRHFLLGALAGRHVPGERGGAGDLIIDDNRAERDEEMSLAYRDRGRMLDRQPLTRQRPSIWFGPGFIGRERELPGFERGLGVR